MGLKAQFSYRMMACGGILKSHCCKLSNTCVLAAFLITEASVALIEELKVINGGEPPKPRKEFIDVVVTNMNDDGSFGIQVIGDSVNALDKLMKEFRAFHKAGSPAPANLRAGELVAARFSADNEFYRAKVKKVDRAAQKADVVRFLQCPR